jgi:NlpC/P60 family putative phage cell wall peptidase
MPTESEIAIERAAVVAEAEAWLGTPFHHEARVKGAGVDCAQLLAGVYHNAGLIPNLNISHYPHDWHMHRDAERYLATVFQYAVEVQGLEDRTPLPGDIVVFRFGRTFSHGAIVTAWPMVIHAYVGKAVSAEDVSTSAYLQTIGENTADKGHPRPMRVFILKRWAE